MNTSHTIRVNPAHTLAILAKGLVDAGIMTAIQAKSARITLYRVKEHKGKPGIGLTIEVLDVQTEKKVECRIEREKPMNDEEIKQYILDGHKRIIRERQKSC